MKPYLGLALVDLTGKRQQDPSFAHFSSENSVYAASIAKAAALLGAHQLRHDVQALANHLQQSNPNVTANEIIARAKHMFGGSASYVIRDKLNLSRNATGTWKATFTPNFDQQLIKMVRFSNNGQASIVISKVGFNIIGSSLWTHGIYSPKRNGGLWIGRGYGGRAGAWHRDPVNNLSHGASAISLGIYFALLGQDRLISSEASQSMRTYLYKSRFSIKFIRGFKRAGYTVNKPESASPLTKKVNVYRKSGTFGKVSHDANLIERKACMNAACSVKKDLRYVAVGTTDGGPAYRILPRVIMKLDACIVANNQTPTLPPNQHAAAGTPSSPAE